MAVQKSNSALYIAVLIGMVLLAVIYLIFSGDDHYDWSESFEPGNDQPYGTMIFHKLMKEVRNEQTFVMVKDTAFKELPVNPTPQVDNYIYIGEAYYAN